MAYNGIARTRKNFRVAFKNITMTKTDAALRAIMQEAGASSDQMTPIDTGNLVNSRYAPVITQTEEHSTARIGYTADYAAAVHDHEGASRGKGIPRDRNNLSRGNFWDPNAEPQFMAKGFEKIFPDIPKILKAVYGV